MGDGPLRVAPVSTAAGHRQNVLSTRRWRCQRPDTATAQQGGGPGHDAVAAGPPPPLPPAASTPPWSRPYTCAGTTSSRCRACCSSAPTPTPSSSPSAREVRGGRLLPRAAAAAALAVVPSAGPYPPSPEPCLPACLPVIRSLPACRSLRTGVQCQRHPDWGEGGHQEDRGGV